MTRFHECPVCGEGSDLRVCTKCNDRVVLVCLGCEAFRRLGNAKQSASGAWGRYHAVREYAHSSKATGEHNNGCLSSKRPPKRFRCKAVRRALMQQLWEAILAEPETEASSAQQAIRPARDYLICGECATRERAGRGRWNYKVSRACV